MVAIPNSVKYLFSHIMFDDSDCNRLMLPSYLVNNLHILKNE